MSRFTSIVAALFVALSGLCAWAAAQSALAVVRRSSPTTPLTDAVPPGAAVNAQRVDTAKALALATAPASIATDAGVVDATPDAGPAAVQEVAAALATGDRVNAEASSKDAGRSESKSRSRSRLRDAISAHAEKPSDEKIAEMPADEDATSLQEKNGWVRFAVPDNAEVWVNGRMVGIGPIDNHPLSVGTHSVKFRCTQADGTQVSSSPQAVEVAGGRVDTVSFDCP